MTQPEVARVERGPITEVPHFALGMAALLERQGFTVAAAELRRQHEEIMELRHGAGVANQTIADLAAQRDALLKSLKEIYDWTAHKNTVWATKASAAIKAAEENT